MFKMIAWYAIHYKIKLLQSDNDFIQIAGIRRFNLWVLAGKALDPKSFEFQ